MSKYNTDLDYVIPDHDETLLLRGKAYYLAGEKEKAKKVFDEYKKRKHNDVNINNEFIKLFSNIEIFKDKSFFSDYILMMSIEEYNKLPILSLEELLNKLENEEKDN